MEQVVKLKSKDDLVKEIRSYCLFAATGLFAALGSSTNSFNLISLGLDLIIAAYTLTCLYMAYKTAKQLAEAK
ncbi:MAG: hypothetical protein HRT45_18905 [Bdellovibrionales bacterium]|nr:hypothetical protein [Bdellovibrionales bacterium]